MTKKQPDYFEALIRLTPSYKAAANWLLGPVKSYLNENNLSISEFPGETCQMASLIALVEEGQGSFFHCFIQNISGTCVRNSNGSVTNWQSALNLIQTGDEAQILEWVQTGDG